MSQLMVDKAMNHLRELGAFEASNPTLAKAVAMRRLMDEGASESDAHQAVSMAFRGKSGMKVGDDYESALELAVELTEEWLVEKRGALSFTFTNKAHEFIAVVVDAMIEDDARIELAKCLFRKEFNYE